MATRRYKLNPGENLGDVTEEVGAAVNSDAVELTVDLATTYVNTATGTRQISKEEVLKALELFQQYIIKSQWPPA